MELLVALTGLGVLVLAWTHPLWGGALALPCPFRVVTGVPCPTCGGTRALVAAARGDVLAALGLNPMVALAVVGLLGVVPWATAAAVAGWTSPPVELWARRHHRVVAVVGGVAVLANWAFVVASGTV